MAPAKMAAQAARTTLKLTTAPFSLSLRVWVGLLKLVMLTLTLPHVVFRTITSFANNLLGNKLRTEIEGVSQYSKVLRQETHQLQRRLQAYEAELKKSERLREDTFEEMREIRAEVARVFDAVSREKKASHGSVRGERRASFRHARSLRQEPSRLPRWLTHVSVLLALSLLWSSFARGKALEMRSVERKLLITACLPMIWLYIKSLLGHQTGRDDTKNRFVVSSIAWFLVGFYAAPSSTQCDNEEGEVGRAPSERL